MDVSCAWPVIANSKAPRTATITFSRGRVTSFPSEEIWSRGPLFATHESAIRIQHDAVPGLACFKSGEGLVDLAHREVLGLRRDIVP